MWKFFLHLRKELSAIYSTCEWKNRRTRDQACINPNIFCKILFPASLHDRMIITRCIKNVRLVLCPESEIRILSTPWRWKATRTSMENTGMLIQRRKNIFFRRTRCSGTFQRLYKLYQCLTGEGRGSISLNLSKSTEIWYINCWQIAVTQKLTAIYFMVNWQ